MQVQEGEVTLSILLGERLWCMLVSQAGLFVAIFSDQSNLSELVTSQEWTPRDETERAVVERNINQVQVEALRQLVPDSGAYLNEVELRVCLFHDGSLTYF